MRKYRQFVIGLLVGGALMFAMPSMAAVVKQYALTEVGYPIEVNGTSYVNSQLPILNYQSNTYIPLRAVGNLLGANVNWNSVLKRVEIRNGEEQSAQNNAFRNVRASGTAGHYTVTGEGRVFEATMNYAVEDGHDYLLEKSYALDEGAPAWSEFTLNISIPHKQLPINGTLTLELFEYSAKDGTRINTLSVPLETFLP
ncbi:Gmad2 immunoglobulin-like domain-containing protein [Cohnella lupini]|uniref:Copper amine oxidase-like protein n=1 Tax=Cohnella lupini TaxID=1294267 RepID=A0A3D9HQT8_9BACL|nr:Gmad2 immunoglobulin-like domain-containing protein [Cohnella lupini]RED51755.1 copper amine oxidase-like protein [Cohnella lupini]